MSAVGYLYDIDTGNVSGNGKIDAARIGLEGLLLASALSLLGSFLVAPQAFTNYYSFAGALLLLSGLAAAGRRRAA